MADADLLILGGGCAGLSLGVRLAEAQVPGHTLILEARQAYAHDRTWCFWRQGAHRFEHLVSRSWQRMELSSPARRVAFSCAATPYQMIPADRFYAEAQRVIAASARVRLTTGACVFAAPRYEHGRWFVSTTAGEISAREIIDTRPQPALPNQDTLLWQSFLGQEVVCAAPVFDPDVAGLMHFVPGGGGEIMFRYVLASSPTRALIETTIFAAHRLGVADLAGLQADSTRALCGGAGARVIRKESGILPMGLAPHAPPPGPHYVRAGLMAGAARPSTGYAFQRIQAWAEATAARVAAGGQAQGHAPDPLLRRRMDRLFLQVLRAHPARGPELFLRMFGNAGADRVIRFLSDRGTLADCAIIGRSLPIGLFLGALARGVAGGARGGAPEGGPAAPQPA